MNKNKDGNHKLLTTFAPQNHKTYNNEQKDFKLYICFCSSAFGM